MPVTIIRPEKVDPVKVKILEKRMWNRRGSSVRDIPRINRKTFILRWSGTIRRGTNVGGGHLQKRKAMNTNR